MVQIELVVPWCRPTPRFPGTRPDSNHPSTPESVNTDEVSSRVDASLESHIRSTERTRAHQPVVIAQPVNHRIYLVDISGIPKLIVDRDVPRRVENRVPDEISPGIVHSAPRSRDVFASARTLT